MAPLSSQSCTVDFLLNIAVVLYSLVIPSALFLLFLLFLLILRSSCHVCHGHGEVLRTPKHRCPHCHGTKVVPDNQILRVTIPPGVPSSGHRIFFPGMGSESPYRLPSDIEVENFISCCVSLPLVFYYFVFQFCVCGTRYMYTSILDLT